MTELKFWVNCPFKNLSIQHRTVLNPIVNQLSSDLRVKTLHLEKKKKKELCKLT